MVFESIRRRGSVWGIICFIMLAVLVLYGCDPRSNQYPFQKAEYWSSNNPSISLCYTKNNDDTWTFREQLIWNNNTMGIQIAMQSDYYCVYPAESNHHDDRLFSGTWKYCKGNLVLTIEEDFIFGDQFSQITLVPNAD